MYASLKSLEKFKLPSVFVCCFSITTLIYVVGVSFNDMDHLNSYMYYRLHYWFNWYLFFLILSSLVGIYIVCLTFFVVRNLLKGRNFRCALCSKLIVIFTALICYVYTLFFASLHDYKYTSLDESFRILVPFFHIVFLVCHVGFLILITYIPGLDSHPSLNVISYSLWAMVYIIIFFLPLMYKNDCVSNDKLASKPLLLAHRGLQNRAPENTYMAFQKVIENCNDDVFGFETDVRFSRDGIPFLMHDSDLRRTTNVALIFPHRLQEPAENFTWAELQQLNAGKWFLQDNPFMENHLLSAEEKEEAGQQKVMHFKEFIELAKKGNKSVIFDLNRPPEGHVSRNNFKTVLIKIINDVGLDQSQVLWLDGSPTSSIFDSNPDFTYVYHQLQLGLEPELDALNLHYSDLLDPKNNMYKIEDIKIITYVINAYWLFSMTWCRGSWAVTTSYPCKLAAYNRPLFYLRTFVFYFVWLGLSFLSLFVVVIILCWKRDRVHVLKMLQTNHLKESPMASNSLESAESVETLSV